MATPGEMRDKAEAAAKAGKYGDAMEAYFAAEKLYRDAKSPAAADSMKSAAQEMAKKAKKAGDKAYAAKPAQSQADTDKNISDLKKWAAARGGAKLKDPKTGKLFG